MKLSYIEHIEEIRSRIISVIVFFCVFAIVGYFCSGEILRLSVGFINNVTLVSISPVDNIIAKLKLSMFLAFIVSVPYLVYHILAYIKPAIQKKKLLGKMFIVSFALYVISLIFGVLLIITAGKYFAFFNQSFGIVNIWSVTKFVDFAFVLLFGMIIVFQMPLVLYFLKNIGIVNAKFLSKYRRYIYVGWFILAAIITPPDVVTLFVLSIPMIILYELSIQFLRF